MLDDEKRASLFRPVDPERAKNERALMAAVDQRNVSGGRGTVATASAGVGRKERPMRRDRMPPCYPTRLEDVPGARQ